MNQLPCLRGTGRNAALYVDGQPFFMRSGEVHNSSASSLCYMEQKVWPALRGKHLNSLIVPVYWECIEPEEGLFDFSLVDGLLAQARREGVRLELLWFGIWKNSSSTYVPAWVKQDRERFWYVRTQEGKITTYCGGITFTLSPFCQEAIQADKRAFVQLMKHLRQTDEEHTVILIQVENEMGVLGTAMDCSPAAQELFSRHIPAELAAHLQKDGTWEEVFGKDAQETFMAWYYARATEQIAAAGKAELPLPMSVNAWLEQEPWYPGGYPSGGPQFKNYDIWRLAAPSIDLYAPDIYVPYFRKVCQEYTGKGNPLFIPETRAEAAFYLYAVGEHNALCFAPFGIEDVLNAAGQLDAETMALLRISPDVIDAMQRSAQQLFAAYAIGENAQSVILEAHRQGKIRGFLCSGEKRETVPLGDVRLEVSYEHTADSAPAGGGFVLEMGKFEYLVAAINCTFDFQADGLLLDTLTKEDGRFADGRWQRDRILNGDERYHHVVGNQVALYRFQLLPVKE